MRDFGVGSPFTVLDRDVWLLDRTMVDCFPEPSDLSRALLAHRLFRLPPTAPLPRGVLVREIVGRWEWDLVLPESPGPTPTLYVAIDAPKPAVGVLAAFAGWWPPGEGGLPALLLRSPESFRMAFREEIPTYGRRFMYQCWRREAARRGIQ
jgi:hypothetical protein